MPIRVTCPGCQTAYTLPDTQLGKQLRCKNYQAAFRIPAAAAARPPAAEPTVVENGDVPIIRARTDTRSSAVHPGATKPTDRRNGLVVGVAVLGGLFLFCAGIGVGGVGTYFLMGRPVKGPGREEPRALARGQAPAALAPTVREAPAPAPRPADAAPVNPGPEKLPAKAVAGKLFRQALPIDSGTARCEIESGPPGMTLTERKEILWLPGKDAVGTQDFSVRVIDGGQTTVRRFQIDVQEDTSVAASPPPRPRPDLTRPGANPPAEGADVPLPNLATLPANAVSGEPFQYQLPNAGGTARYELHPGFAQRFKDFQLSPDGRIAWTPPYAWPGRPLNFTVMVNGQPRSYNLEIEEDPDAILSLPALAGWVMMPDGVTLIASLPDKGQLVYVDTVTAKETKRVEVSFRPTELALQGGSLFAVGEGSSTLYVLDPATGAVKKEIKVSGAPLRSVACHPRKGLVYVSNGEKQILAVEPGSSKVHPTHAQGMFLAVDPAKGDAVYAGLQGQIRDVIVIRRVGGGRYTLNSGVVGAQAVLLKYAVNGPDLQAVGANENPANNGKLVRLSADGKEVGVVGAGGCVDPATNSRTYGVALFDNEDVKSMRGMAPCGAYPANLAFHPVLDLGATEQGGLAPVALHVFNSKSLVEVATVPFGSPDGGNAPPPPSPAEIGRARPETSLLAFGAKGTKLIYHDAHGLYLRFIPLRLSDKDREALEKAYGKPGTAG